MWSFTRKPESRHTLHASELYDAIHDQLSSRMASHCTIRLADRDNYATCSDAEARKWVQQATGFYTPETRDCDDVCFMAKAACIKDQFRVGTPLAFGILWTPAHAMNFYLNHLLRIVVIDQDLQWDWQTKEINLVMV